MRIEHSALELSTHYKGRLRAEPVWIGRYIIDGKDSRRTLGKAWTKRSRPADGYMNREAAQAAFTSFLRELGARITAEQGMQFIEILDEYIALLKSRINRGDFKASTFQTYVNIIERDIRPRWADRGVEAISAEDVETFREELATRGVSATTLNQYRAIIRGIYKVAKRYKVDPSPGDAWEWAANRRGGSGAISFYTPDQVMLLIEAAKTEHDAALFMTAAFTGLRIGELRALRWRSIDVTDSLIHVEKGYTDPFEHDGQMLGGEDLPKSYKVRSMPLMPQVAEMLIRLRERDEFTADFDLVFGNALGQEDDYNQIQRRYKAAQRRAGLRRIRFHDLRHSFGTMAIRVGSIVDVQTWMGHADIQTTRKYLHYAPQPDAAKALGTLVSERLAPVVPIRKAS